MRQPQAPKPPLGPRRWVMPKWLPSYLRAELSEFDLWLLRCCAVAWALGMVAAGFGLGWGYLTARAAAFGAGGMMATNLILRRD